VEFLYAFRGRVGGRPRLVLDRDQVRRLRDQGKSLREISDIMNLSALPRMRTKYFCACQFS
jgi:hypothetical protein